MTYILPLIVLAVLAFYLWKQNRPEKHDWILPSSAFPKNWRVILQQEIAFYNSLSPQEQQKFEYQIQEFLLNYKITGIKTEVSLVDKLMVASSAVIPVFGFDQWKYTHLDEVLIYPNSFNFDYEVKGKDRNVLGMVGNGPMEGVMILSQEALRHGFKNDSDKKNTAIHEFVHLIDKVGGPIDGLPSVLMQKQYAIPWLSLIDQKLEEIYEQKSDINPYGGTNKAEFFSVVSEYFFERPKLLKRKHPKLYQLLEQVFNQDMSARTLQRSQPNIERNSPCPCGSGKKYKQCCGVN